MGTVSQCADASRMQGGGDGFVGKAGDGLTVMVCSGDDASGYNYTAGSLGRDMRAFGKELNARLQGRGGGSAQMVQGTFRASREEIEKVFQELARIEA